MRMGLTLCRRIFSISLGASLMTGLRYADTAGGDENSELHSYTSYDEDNVGGPKRKLRISGVAEGLAKNVYAGNMSSKSHRNPNMRHKTYSSSALVCCEHFLSAQTRGTSAEAQWIMLEDSYLASPRARLPCRLPHQRLQYITNSKTGDNSSPGPHVACTYPPGGRRSGAPD